MANKKCRILFVGDSSYDMYVKAYYNAAKMMDNIDAILIDFDKLNTNVSKETIIPRVERHYKIGLDIYRINYKLIKYVELHDIDIVFLYACDIITDKTIRWLSQKSYVAIYNNDNIFSDYYPKYMWRYVKKSLKYADIVYSYRKSNIAQYKQYGAKQVKLMRSYYIKERNYYIPDEQIDIEVPDVVYIGHYENDGRIEYIKALVEKNIRVGVTEEWKTLGINSDNLIYLSDTHSKYNEILNKAKIAIVFLSTINDDTYTRRCFEIPVVKTMMVAPENSDIKELFENNKEACFYNDLDDFVRIVQYYIEHNSERKQIAESGYERLIRDGHEAADRVKDIIEDWNQNIRTKENYCL